jgi:hypothetical protein
MAAKQQRALRVRRITGDRLAELLLVLGGAAPEFLAVAWRGRP